jgi:Cu/Ag efflux pump CusA
MVGGMVSATILALVIMPLIDLLENGRQIAICK